MLNIVAYLLIAFFCSFGFIALLYTLCCRAAVQNDEPIFLLLPVHGAEEKIEFQIKSAKALLQCAKTKGEKHIIVLDNGMDEGTRQIVLKEIQDSKNIRILRANELQNLR